MSVFLNLDERRLIEALREAARKLDGIEGEAVLDFSSVSRIDASAVWALEELARVAGEKSIKLILTGVKVDVYKALKLMKLAARFSFVN